MLEIFNFVGDSQDGASVSFSRPDRLRFLVRICRIYIARFRVAALMTVFVYHPSVK